MHTKDSAVVQEINSIFQGIFDNEEESSLMKRAAAQQNVLRAYLKEYQTVLLEEANRYSGHALRSARALRDLDASKNKDSLNVFQETIENSDNYPRTKMLALSIVAILSLALGIVLLATGIGSGIGGLFIGFVSLSMFSMFLGTEVISAQRKGRVIHDYLNSSSSFFQVAPEPVEGVVLSKSLASF